jgi:hypothetical protein
VVKQFVITDEDEKKINEWDKCAKDYHGTIGGHLRYEFIPTSIGVVKLVKCYRCGEQLDLTDYDNW